jgi:hypothetical protein
MSKPTPERIRKDALEVLAFEKKVGMHYVRGGTVPSAIPTGYVLVHNHVKHTKRTPSSANGFRGWFQDEARGSKHIPPAKLAVCNCGWAGLPHYRVVLPV